MTKSSNPELPRAGLSVARDAHRTRDSADSQALAQASGSHSLRGCVRHPPEMRNVYRIGEGEGRAWSVQLSGGTPRRKYGKTFADARYGGTEKALAAAQAWRDTTKPAPQQGKLAAAVRLRKSNTSGRAGVRRGTHRKRYSDGREVLFFNWVAKTPNTVKPARTRMFSIAKYGDRQAFRLAVAARKAFEAEMAQAVVVQPSPVLPPLAKRAPIRSIQRLDDHLEKAWRVTVNRISEGLRFNKQFRDSQFGGEAGALAAALSWRDEIERLHPRLTRAERAERLRRTNTSGKTGVMKVVLVVRRRDGSERIAENWTAQTPGGVKPRRSRMFSTEKYGEREAYRLAVEARRAFEALLGDVR
jgi:hypothetical protein